MVPEESVNKAARQLITFLPHEAMLSQIQPPTLPPSAALLPPPLVAYLQSQVDNNRFFRLPGAAISQEMPWLDRLNCFIPLHTVQLVDITPTGNRQFTEDSLAGDNDILRIRTPHQQITQTRLIRIDRALSENRFLFLIGDPGAGKTFLLRYLNCLFANDYLNSSNHAKETFPFSEPNTLPILLSFHDLSNLLAKKPRALQSNDTSLILEALKQQISEGHGELPAEILLEHLKSGNAILLFDDFDTITDPNLRTQLTRILLLFTRQYPKCRCIVTSRPTDPTDLAALGIDYAIMTLHGLVSENAKLLLTRLLQLADFIQNPTIQPSRIPISELTTTKVNTLWNAIQNNERLLNLACNPFFLSLMVLVFEMRHLNPITRANLLEESLNALLETIQPENNALLNCTIEDNPLDSKQKLSILQTVAFTLQENKRLSLPAEALWRVANESYPELLVERHGGRTVFDHLLEFCGTNLAIITTYPGGRIGFSHRLLQEILCALAIVKKQDFITYSTTRMGDEWWRQVLLLESGILGIHNRQQNIELLQAFAGNTKNVDQYYLLSLAGEGFYEGNFPPLIGVPIRSRMRELIETKKTDIVNIEHSKKGKRLIYQRTLVTQALQHVGGGYWTGPNYEPEWIKIPEGTFTMGNDYGPSDEAPAHNIFLKTYWISSMPITNIQYSRFINESHYLPPPYWDGMRTPKGKEFHPVVGIRWYDAIAYCQWLSQVTSKNVTLPSEAEWEKATSGLRTDPRKQPSSNPPIFSGNISDLNIGDTTPVGIFPEVSSAYGVSELLGNVWEWTRSLWGRETYRPTYVYPYDPNDGREELNAPNTIARILRGGSFFYRRSIATATFRYRNYPVHGFFDFGFRVIFIP